MERPSNRTPVIDAEALADVRHFRSVRPDPAVPSPTSIEIPSIEVTSELQQLGRDAEGAIEIPSAWGVAAGTPKGYARARWALR